MGHRDMSENSGSDSETDELVNNLVNKYSKSKVDEPPSTSDGHVESGNPLPKEKKKRTLTPKLKAHLEEQRKVAVVKRKQYAAERRQQKEEDSKRKYMAELESLAEQKLQKVLSKIQPRKKKRTMIQVSESETESTTESESDGESVEIVPKKTKKHKKVVVEKKAKKEKPTIRKVAQVPDLWDDYFM